MSRLLSAIVNSLSLLCIIGLSFLSIGLVARTKQTSRLSHLHRNMNMDKVVKSEEEWKKSLPPDRYRIMREKGTEPAFTGKFWNHHEDGSYTCAACGQELFRSGEKFDSG